MLVPKSGSYYGRPLQTERGVIWGDPFHSTVFNTMVDEVVRAVLLEVCDLQEEHHGM